jgi:hypothetical protein
MELFFESPKHDLLQGAKLHISTEPQLSVCRGLLCNFRQSLGNVPMFPRRCARASFGIPYRKRYSRRLCDHWKTVQREAKKARRISTDQFNQKWITDCVDWFIRKVVTPCLRRVKSLHSLSYLTASWTRETITSTLTLKQGSRVIEGQKLAYNHCLQFAPDIPESERLGKVQIMTSLHSPPPPYVETGMWKARKISDKGPK